MPRPKVRLFFIGLALALMGPAAALAEVRTFQLENVQVEEILPVLRELLAPETKASGIGRQLVVRGSAGELAEVEKIVGQLDVARQVLRVTVRQEARSAETGTRFEASGQLSRGDLEAGLGAPVEKQQIRSGASTLQAGGARRIGNAAESRDQFVQVLDGEEAWLTIGREVPYTREFALLIDRFGAEGFSQSTDFQQVSTGFVVRPLLQGDRVLLEVTPFLADFDSRSDFAGGARAVSFQKATTTTRVPLGTWYDLGGHLQSSSEVGRSFVSYRTRNDEARRQIWVMVEKVH